MRSTISLTAKQRAEVDGVIKMDGLEDTRTHVKMINDVMGGCGGAYGVQFPVLIAYLDSK